MSDVQLNSGFFNATLVDGEPDRVYTAEQVNDYFTGLVSDSGVFANVSTACQVLAGTGMQVIVKAGRGKVGNNWFEIDRDLTVDLSASDVVLNRIDGIFIQRDSSNRLTKLTVKSSSLATNPTAPDVTRNESIYEICLARIAVNKNVSSISQSNITDTRPNNSLCGWITGLIDQMDTETLFNQYQDAQNEFLNDKSSEFNTWFNNIKDQVSATSLYREYRATYTTSTADVSTIPIPSSLNFLNNGLDILNVYINGFRMNQNEYSISGSNIVLTNALTQSGTIIEFVNSKSVEGTVAESTVLRVEALEEKVNALDVSSYTATGTDDNITLSNLVKSFLDATGDYASIADNASMIIHVNGVLGISSLIDDSYVFDFNSESTSRRRIIIDFAGATIPQIEFVKTSLAVMSCTDHVKIINANIKVKKHSQTLYVLYGGSYDHCHVYVDCDSTSNTCYGAYSCLDVSNCDITIENGVTNAYGIYSCERSLFNRITMNIGNSIRAVNTNMMIGNIVNKEINKGANCVEIATVTVS